MKAECSHCGHAFETGDDLATCPKCEQVSQAIVPRNRLTSKPEKSRMSGVLLIAAFVVLLLIRLVRIPAASIGPHADSDGNTVYPDGSVIPAKQIEATVISDGSELRIGNYGSWNWPETRIIINGEFQYESEGVTAKGNVEIPLAKFARQSDGLRFNPIDREVMKVEISVSGSRAKIFTLKERK